MQLGQPQPAFANRKESWVGRVIRQVNVLDVVWLTGVIFHLLVGWRDIRLNQSHSG